MRHAQPARDTSARLKSKSWGPDFQATPDPQLLSLHKLLIFTDCCQLRAHLIDRIRSIGSPREWIMTPVAAYLLLYAHTVDRAVSKHFSKHSQALRENLKGMQPCKPSMLWVLLIYLGLSGACIGNAHCIPLRTCEAVRHSTGHSCS